VSKSFVCPLEVLQHVTGHSDYFSVHYAELIYVLYNMLTRSNSVNGKSSLKKLSCSTRNFINVHPMWTISHTRVTLVFIGCWSILSYTNFIHASIMISYERFETLSQFGLCIARCSSGTSVQMTKCKCWDGYFYYPTPAGGEASHRPSNSFHQWSSHPYSHNPW